MDLFSWISVSEAIEDLQEELSETSLSDGTMKEDCRRKPSDARRTEDADVSDSRRWLSTYFW